VTASQRNARWRIPEPSPQVCESMITVPEAVGLIQSKYYLSCTNSGAVPRKELAGNAQRMLELNERYCGS
jgi:hypothetical protein